MIHTCHARGCGKSVAPELLMCGFHWKMVPPTIKKLVYAAYRPGQCDDKRPSAAWHAAADAAIGFVALRTGQVVRNVEIRELVKLGYERTIIRTYVNFRGTPKQIVEDVLQGIMSGESDRVRAAAGVR